MRPACHQRAHGPALHANDASRVVVHIGSFFMDRTDETCHFHDFIVQQITDKVGFVHAEIAHGAHNRFFFAEEPAVPSIQAPALRTAVAKGSTEGKHFSELAGIQNFLRFTCGGMRR